MSSVVLTLFSSSALDFQCFSSGSLGCGESRGQHAEWRTRNVVQSSAIAELDGRWLTSMFAANSHLQIGARLAPAFCRHLHQLAHALLIERGKWILLQNALGKICRQHFVDVVT